MKATNATVAKAAAISSRITAIEKINKAISEKKNVQKKLTEKEEISLRAGKILGKSPAMQDLFNSIGKLSHSDSTVLLVGESGTGKELVSQAIFEHSDRSNKKNASKINWYWQSL